MQYRGDRRRRQHQSAWTPASATAGSTARIDRTAPTTPTVSGGSLVMAGRGDAITITGSGASGGDSGLSGYEHRSSTDGGTSWGAPTAGASVNITAEGETLVQLRAIDGAGNIGAWAPAHAGSPDAAGTVRLGPLALGPQRRLSVTGPDGDPSYDAIWPDAAHNTSANEYLVVWTADTGAAREDEVWGRLVSGSGEWSGAAFRISDMGPEGNPAYTAWEPRVTYNPTADEYLVVWFGDDDAGSLADNEFEVYAQRVSAAGAEVGANDVRISSMGPDGNAAYDAWNPRVAYNGDADEYMVTWEGDDNSGGLVDNEFEIFAQRLSPTLAERGTDDQRISDMGPDGNAAYDALRPDIAYNPLTTEYLVAWQGDDDTAPLVDNETEIFVQRLSATGAELGTNDQRVSDMGADGNPAADALTPSIAVNRGSGDYLVTWSGDDATGWHGRRRERDLRPAADRRAAPRSGPTTSASRTWAPTAPRPTTPTPPPSPGTRAADQYLVTWSGTDDAPGLAASELEVHAQRLLADGSAFGPNDIRVSTMGPDGDPTFGVGRAGLASGTGSLTFLATWDASDSTGALVSGENEIHTRLLAIDPTAPSTPTLSGGSSAWQSLASVTVTASGSADAESGLAGYQRRTSTDGGATWSAVASASSISVSAEGETLVGFRAVNGNGDQGAWAEAIVRLDRTAPATPTATGGALAWQNPASVTVSGAGSAGGPSGLTWEHRTSTDAGTSWSAPAAGGAVAVSAAGETLVQFRATDGAANASGWGPGAGAAGATVRLDRTAPSEPAVSRRIGGLAEHGLDDPQRERLRRCRGRGPGRI